VFLKNMNEQEAKDAVRERQIEALKAAPPKPIAYEQSSVSYYTAGFDDGWQLAIEYHQQDENQRYREALELLQKMSTPPQLEGEVHKAINSFLQRFHEIASAALRGE
jgi:hypothetical protein